MNYRVLKNATEEIFGIYIYMSLYIFLYKSQNMKWPICLHVTNKNSY
jgi:hypothetical protein